MYVCVAENAELLVIFYCHQSQKLEFCSYFSPKKCPPASLFLFETESGDGLGLTMAQ